MLKKTVTQLQKIGFKVIFDLQPNTRHRIWGDRALLDAANKDYFKRFANLVEELSRQVSSFDSGTIALELSMNLASAVRGQTERVGRKSFQIWSGASAPAATLSVIVSGGSALLPMV